MPRSNLKTLKRHKRNDPYFANPRFQKMLDKSLEQKNREEFPSAATSLRHLVRAFPRSPLANWLLGAVLYFELSKPKSALPFFKKAVRLRPDFENGSLGLFHCLWDLDRVDEALGELKRFQLLTNWSCRDYVEILKEIREKWLPPQETKK